MAPHNPPPHPSLLIAANKSPGTADSGGVGGLGLVCPCLASDNALCCTKGFQTVHGWEGGCVGVPACDTLCPGVLPVSPKPFKAVLVDI